MSGDAMARTIRVSGLPEDVSENRLVDKLQIHFLRKKNGGGEISAVTVSKSRPGTAFITFEESEVAVRLAQKGTQLFKVSDKSHVITVSLQSEEVDADEVLLCMSVVVDHRKLPGGKDTLFSLQKSVAGVDLAFDGQTELYTVRGRYSQVQTLSSMLLGALEKQLTLNTSSADKPQPTTVSTKTYNSLLPPVESASSQVGASKDTGVVEHTGRTESDLDTEDKSWKTGLSLAGSSGDHATSAENQWDSDIESMFEDFSLIVDSDIFCYLYQYCSKEYQSILRQHKVEVLDVNCDDITTLYLKPKAALSPHDMSCVIKAHEDLAHLYLQKQSQLRKEHVSKPGIPEKELTRALESLRERLPNLMIHEGDGSVHMIGSKSDVSEAKQFISDMQGIGLENETHSEPFTPSHSKWKEERADSQDLFMPKKDLQHANQRWTTNETSSKKAQNSVKLKTVDEPIKKTTKDIFDYRRSEVSQEKHVAHDSEWMETGSGLDKNKYTDSLFDSSKLSASQSVIDIDRKSFSMSHFISGKMVDNSETQIKSSKGYKTKQTETGKARRMATNFSREMYSGTKDFKSDSCVSERKLSDSEQLQSLPNIKPSLNSNLNLNALRGGPSAQISTGKMEIQELQGDNRKPTITPACWSGEQEPKGFPTMPLESTLRRSSSFSGRIKKVEEATRTAVDLSAGQKETTPSSETREIVAMNVVLSFRLWLYLTSVYNTEIENLTSDLQVKESLEKENIILCLRGLDGEKVHECYCRLKRLVATAETDFDARTLPLSKLGVPNNKDKILIDLCTLLKQHYKMVKILVMSNDVMILGPKSLCDNVEDTLTKVFHEQGNTANSKLDNKLSPKPGSLHTSKEPDSDLKLLANQTTTSAKPQTDISVQDPSKISDQSVASSLKTVPQDLTKHTRASREQEERRQNKKKAEQLERLDEKDSTLLQSYGGTWNIDSATKQNKADHQTNRDQTDTTAQSNTALIEQKRPGRIRESQEMPFHASRNQKLLLCYVCEKEHSNVKQAACGFNCCPECEDVHNNCRLCEVAGIKGTMSVQESTITIPGFHRDTTLRISYEIPDGIQAEHHPCPGAPFKGNRFEAFLPHNKTTAKLLPLLKKAFHKGLTFTVKVGAPDNAGGQEGRVTWGSIPHKTRTEGGASGNGYPDSNYIKRLEEALKAAGVGE